MKWIGLLVVMALSLAACRSACCPGKAAGPEQEAVAEFVAPAGEADTTLLPGLDRVTVGGEGKDMPTARDETRGRAGTTSQSLRDAERPAPLVPAGASSGRTAKLMIQPNKFLVGGTLDALVGTMSSTGVGDAQILVTVYVTPPNGRESQTGTGRAHPNAKGDIQLKLAHPLSMYAPGSAVRVVFEAYNDNGIRVWKQQQSVMLP